MKGTVWVQTIWQDEPSWMADSAGWRAIVSESRSRLTYLGLADEDSNLLLDPCGSLSEGEAPPLGGHVLWLGPQSYWHWPPPRDWQCLERIEPEAEGASLRLYHPQKDPRFPRLVRSYQWDGPDLICGAAWEGTTPLHAIHILQLPKDFIIQASAAKELPQGFASFHQYSLELAPPQLEGVERTGDSLVFRYTNVSAKFALPAQTLHAVRGHLALQMQPCVSPADPCACPDQGLITQLWRGNDELPFLEIEQLSALHLHSDGAESFVRLRPILLQMETGSDFISYADDARC